MLNKEKYLKYKKIYINLKKQSIIKGGKPIHYFNDDNNHSNIYYLDLSDKIQPTSIANNFCKNCTKLKYINLSHSI
jgi:hypothetical protein